MRMPEMALSDFLNPTPIVDADHPAVAAYTSRQIAGVSGDQARATASYYAISRRIIRAWRSSLRESFEQEVKREIAESAR